MRPPWEIRLFVSAYSSPLCIPWFEFSYLKVHGLLGMKNS